MFVIRRINRSAVDSVDPEREGLAKGSASASTKHSAPWGNMPDPERRWGPVDGVVDVEVLTAGEAASLLRVSEKTLLRLARAGTLPGRKVGREWRFLRQELLRQLETGSPL